MAWIMVKEQGHLAESEATAEERTAKRVFIVRSDTPTTPIAAETASFGGVTIPLGDEVHPDDPARIVVTINAKPDPESNRTVFIVEVSYSNKAADGESTPEDDPLDRPDEVHFEGASDNETVFLTEETVPRPIVTSAGETFDAFQERTSAEFKIVIEGNRASIDPAQVAAYLKPNAVNSAAVTIRGIVIATGEAKMVGFGASPTTEGATTYLRCRWELALAADWDLHIEDRGYNEKDGPTFAKIKEIVKGRPPVKVDKPWPLNGIGTAKPFSTDAPAVLDFPVYPKLPFSVWGWTVA